MIRNFQRINKNITYVCVWGGLEIRLIREELSKSYQQFQVLQGYLLWVVTYCFVQSPTAKPRLSCIWGLCHPCVSLATKA